MSLFFLSIPFAPQKYDIFLKPPCFKLKFVFLENNCQNACRIENYFVPLHRQNLKTRVK